MYGKCIHHAHTHTEVFECAPCMHTYTCKHTPRTLIHIAIVFVHLRVCMQMPCTQVHNVYVCVWYNAFIQMHTHTLSVCAWCILVYVCIHHSHIIYTYMHIYSWCACSCMCIVYSVCVAQLNWRKGGQLKGEQIEESSMQNDARCMTSFVRYAYSADKNDSEGEINWGSSIFC